MPSVVPAADTRTVRALVTMGTSASLVAWGPAAPTALDAAAAELERLEGLWSRFRPDSDVTRANVAAGEWVPVAAETAELVRLALDLGEVTGGAFDVTLGTAAGREVEVDDSGAVRLPSGSRLDLGGIGKGAAAQRVVALLAGAGVPAALVNLGRSAIGTVGLPPGRDHWRIAVQRPPASANGSWPVLELGGGYLSTSGDYEASSAGGNHIVDPATGLPGDSGVSSATVLAADGARAEAFSTALLVLGVDAGLALHSRVGGFEAVLIDASGVTHTTPGLGGRSD